jgi:hypothetical protein
MGPVKIPMSPRVVRGTIPKLLRLIPVKTSKKKTAHIKKTSLNGIAALPNTDVSAIERCGFWNRK